MSLYDNEIQNNPNDQDRNTSGQLSERTDDHLFNSAYGLLALNDQKPDTKRTGTVSKPDAQPTKQEQAKEKKQGSLDKSSDKGNESVTQVQTMPQLLREFFIEQTIPTLQAAVEDNLAKQPDKAKFNAGLRKQLQEALKDGNISDDLKKSIKKELLADNIRPELKASLEKLLAGNIDAKDKEILADNLVYGLFSKKVMASFVNQEKKEIREGKFGPVCKTAWQEAVKLVEKIATNNLETLLARKLPELEPGAPFSEEEYKQYSKDPSKTPSVSLHIDTDQMPDRKALLSMHRARIWNNEQVTRIHDNQKIPDQKTYRDLAIKFGRGNWCLPDDASKEEKNRRAMEIARVLQPAQQAERALGALKWLVEHREESEGGIPWHEELFNHKHKPYFENNQWMLEAIKTFPGDIEKGKVNIPLTLDNSVANDIQTDDKSIAGNASVHPSENEAIQKWLEKYGPSTLEQFSKLLDNVHNDRYLVYGSKNKDESGGDKPKSPNGSDYNLVNCDFTVEKIKGTHGEDLYKVTQRTDYAQCEIYNPWNALAKVVDSKPLKPQIYKAGELVPVAVGNKLLAVEACRLEEVHWREKAAYSSMKGIKVGTDVIFAVTAARGVGASVGALTKGGVSELTKVLLEKELSKITMGTLGGLGALDNAWMQGSSGGRFLLASREMALMAMVTHDVGRATSQAALTDARYSARLAELAGKSELAAGRFALEEMGVAPRLIEEAGILSEETAALAKPARILESEATLAKPARALESEATLAKPARAIEDTAVLGKPVRAIEGEVALAKSTEVVGSEATALARSATIQNLSESAAGEAVALQQKAKQSLLEKCWDIAKATHDKAEHLALLPMAGIVYSSLGYKVWNKGHKAWNKISGATEGSGNKKHKDSWNIDEADGILREMSDSRMLFDNARASLSANTDPELKERLVATLDRGEKLLTIAKTAPEKEAQIKQISQGLNAKTSSERVAASLALLYTMRHDNADHLGSISSEQLLASLKQELIQSQRARQNGQTAKNKQSEDTNNLSPEASLMVAQHLLAFERISGQQYALEASKVASDSKTTPDGKIQALYGLGLSAWSASNVESGKRSSDFAYWSKSHGCSRQDLEKQLLSITTGTSGEKNPDVKAFAAAMLHGLRYENEDDKGILFERALADWQKYGNDKPGSFAKAFVSRMQEEAKLAIPSQAEQADLIRQRQYLAGRTLVELNPENKKDSLPVIIRCLDTRTPVATARSLQYLADNLDSLPKESPEHLLRTAITLLKAPPLGDRYTAEENNAKVQTLKILPKLLQKTDDPEQLDLAVFQISQMINRSQDNSYYARNEYIRTAAIESLRALNAKSAQPQIIELLAYKDNSPLEASPYVRLAAIQTLAAWRSPETNDLCKSLLDKEKDPRVKREIQMVTARQTATTDKPTLTSLDGKSTNLNFSSAEEFLRKNFPALIKEEFDRMIAANTKDYGSGLGGTSWRAANGLSDSWTIMDTALLPLKLYEYKSDLDKLSKPGQSPLLDLQDMWAQKREDIKRDHKEEVIKLGRWAKGEFTAGELYDSDPEREAFKKNYAQEQAIDCLAMLLDKNGLSTKYAALLPEFDRRASVVYAGQVMQQIAVSSREPHMRARAAGYLVDFVQRKDIDPKAKIKLYSGLSQLPLDQRKLAEISLHAWQNHCLGITPEDKPAAQRTEREIQEKDAHWSFEFQRTVLEDLTYKYGNLVDSLEDTNHKIQLDTAIALTKNTDSPFTFKGFPTLKLTSDDAYYLGLHKLAQLSADKSNPAIQKQASQRLNAIQTEVTKKQNEAQAQSVKPDSKKTAADISKESALERVQQYATFLETLSDLRQSAAKSDEGVLFFFAPATLRGQVREAAHLNPIQATSELNKLTSPDNATLTETQTVQQLLYMGFSTDFSTDGKDAATNFLKNLTENPEDRISLASASILAFRSLNNGQRRFGIEKMTQLEARSGSDVIKKEATILLDQLVEVLKTQIPTHGAQARSLIKTIEIERARAAGLPVSL